MTQTLKAIAIRLQDAEGKVYRWKINHVSRAINCTLGKPNRVVSGWEYTDHDGCIRFAEGNWRDLVAAFKMTAENYGFTLMSELS
jgi:hypothetical protein